MGARRAFLEGILKKRLGGNGHKKYSKYGNKSWTKTVVSRLRMKHSFSVIRFICDCNVYRENIVRAKINWICSFAALYWKQVNLFGGAEGQGPNFYVVQLIYISIVLISFEFCWRAHFRVYVIEADRPTELYSLLLMVRPFSLSC